MTDNGKKQTNKQMKNLSPSLDKYTLDGTLESVSLASISK